MQPREKTLTDAEIEAVAAKIVAAVHEGDRRRASRLTQPRRASERRIVEAEIVVAGEMDHGPLGQAR